MKSRGIGGAHEIHHPGTSDNTDRLERLEGNHRDPRTVTGIMVMSRKKGRLVPELEEVEEVWGR